MGRIHLKFASTELDIEGDQDFINSNSSLLEKFMKNMDISAIELAEARSTALPCEEVQAQVNTIRHSKKNPRKKESFSIVKDLNLRPESGQNLISFYEEKAPSSALEKTTVFVYFLKKILNLPTITPDYIYTCYKEVGAPIPGNLRQNIADTASRKGTIDTSDMSNIQITTVGENYVEFNLTKNGQ